MITITPLNWGYHPEPVDCWRAYPEGLRAVYEDAGLRVETALCESTEKWQARVNIDGFKYLIKRSIGWPHGRPLFLATRSARREAGAVRACARVTAHRADAACATPASSRRAARLERSHRQEAFRTAQGSLSAWRRDLEESKACWVQPSSDADAPPLVSVVIPTADRPQLVARRQRSALAQDVEEIEVVVVVDGPTTRLFSARSYRRRPVCVRSCSAQRSRGSAMPVSRQREVRGSPC